MSTSRRVRSSITTSTRAASKRRAPKATISAKADSSPPRYRSRSAVRRRPPGVPARPRARPVRACRRRASPSRRRRRPGRVVADEPEPSDPAVGDGAPEQVAVAEAVEREHEPGELRPEARAEPLLERALEAAAVADMGRKHAGRRRDREAEQAAVADELEVVRRLPEADGAVGVGDLRGDAPPAVLEDGEEVVAVDGRPSASGRRAHHPRSSMRTRRARRRARPRGSCRRRRGRREARARRRPSGAGRAPRTAPHGRSCAVPTGHEREIVAQRGDVEAGRASDRPAGSPR